MAFHLIDLDRWPRREYYQHYLEEAPCSYSITVELDITPLAGHKRYPAMLWLLTDTVNQLEQFRTCLSPAGLGIFDQMNPSYTVFNQKTAQFSSIWTDFSPDYSVFLERYREDAARYSSAETLFPKPGQPDNCFDVSMVPWVSFTRFHLNLPRSQQYLLPIFTVGRTFSREEKTWLPLAIQVHHGVCDGYHIGQFVERLQQSIRRFP